ncbi:DUF1835 domain-containing protein [Bacillus testis]|uniref:DUF1835 domain-containing protein n=1 Tax=Bacillus testis TaxID=1622072 RepID=UPI00067EA506|nr:DUF1835 domain-containing protein [Bacillus testis]
MIHTLKKRIKDLSEKEAKSLLLQFFIHMHRAEDANNPAQLAADLKELYAEFLKSSLDSFPQPNDKAVHIVFGASMAGSLRVALKELDLDTEEKIIGFSDLFSIGPIWHLQEEKGLVLRHEWLKNHLILDDEYIHFYLEEMDRERLMVEMLPAEVPIIIWTGDNAHEQTASRYMVDMLKNKPNPIALLNTSVLYEQLFYRPDLDYQPLYSGEISPEKIKAIYKQIKRRVS